MERSTIDQKEIEKAISWLNKYWNKPVKPIYYSPQTLDETLSLLEALKGEARIIAGGIDIIGLLKNKIITPRALINIKKIDSFRGIRERDNAIDIGPLTLINDITKSQLIKNKLPMLSELCGSIGSPQIRNMATIGGNLCQDVRCWYYRRPKITGLSFDCLRKNGTKCYAIDGENQYHSIFGEGGCVAVCPSDVATGLAALDGEIHTISPRGERRVWASQFYTALGNKLEPDEMIINIRIPIPDSHTKHKYLKFRERRAIDFSIVSIFSAITFYDSGKVQKARIAIGGVSPIPYRPTHAERMLEGEYIKNDIVEEVAEACVKEAIPLRKNHYKVSLVKALVKRSLL